MFDKNTVEQGHVVRETESYPTYFLGYKKPFNILKDELNQYQNLYPIGRGGMYKYNNQDHSIYSGILAARNYLQIDGSPFNLWKVNVDAEYHEWAERINEWIIQIHSICELENKLDWVWLLTQQSKKQKYKNSL